MDLDADAAYAALTTRDARFDGRFFVGVTSTGIYCRPVCRVRTPGRANCRFFASAAQAEAERFRPCLKCRPEIAPGLSSMDGPGALASAAAAAICEALRRGEAPRMPEIAARLGVTDRHLRRIFVASHGVSPGMFLGTQRLLLAKQLLTDTDAPITQVAHAAGFASLRRFNATFAEHYRMPPSRLRRQARGSDNLPALRLAWRPPYDAAAMAGFFAARALPGVEMALAEQGMRRCLAVTHGGHRLTGWIEWHWVSAQAEVRLRVAPSLAPALADLIGRTRSALDLDADPQRFEAILGGIGEPGMRLPGSFDGFETAVRTVLGQQVSVAAARTLAARLVRALGEPLVTPWPELNRLFPEPDMLATTPEAELAALGIVRQRAAALQALAGAVADGRLDLRPGAELGPTLRTLESLPGIGPWTAQMIALRVLAWPDAFAGGDVGVLRALGVRTPAQAEAAAQAWRPWRGYAMFRLWRRLERSRCPQDLTQEPSPCPTH